MAEILIKGINTEQGPGRIDYTALANKPTCDETLSVSGGMADAKAVGDRISALSSSVTNSLNLKANAVDVNNKIGDLAGKTVKEYVDDLDTASETYVNEKIGDLDGKTVKEYVDDLDTASETYVNNKIGDLSGKTVKAYVDDLETASETYVNNRIGNLSGKTVKSYVDGRIPVPASTSSDNGKFLRVVNGVAAWASVPNAEERGF